MTYSEAATADQVRTRMTRTADDKYLTFALGKELYGLPILKVQEIMGIMLVTPVPHMPDYIRGVVNLRGKVIPVVDLRLKFGMAAIPDSKRTCIVVVHVRRDADDLTMGLIVDLVDEVCNLGAETIEPPPSFGTQVDTSFILGIAKLANRVMMLLDIDKVLNHSALHVVHQLAAKPPAAATERAPLAEEAAAP